MLQFTCHGCDTQFNVPDEYAGRRGRCKVCSGMVQAPMKEAAAPVAVGAGVGGNASTVGQPWQRPTRTARPDMPGGQATAVAEIAPPRESVIPQRTRRLMWEAQMIEQTLQSFPLIRLKSTQGQPPEFYQFEYRVKGLLRGDQQELLVSESHIVEIQLPDNFPDAAPICRMTTPIFHPNMNRAQIGATDLWTRDERLIDLVVQIGRMIGFQSYALRTPLDPEAAMWAEANATHLPVDNRELRPAQMPTATAP